MQKQAGESAGKSGLGFSVGFAEVGYEQARWPDFAAAVVEAKIAEATVPPAFRNAWQWSRRAFAAS
jgi:hypothetical protein